MIKFEFKHNRRRWFLRRCFFSKCQLQLEQLECLCSEDTPAASWLPTLLSHVGSQVKTRSNDLEDIGHHLWHTFFIRSSPVTHFLMLVIICTKYGKNPSRTADTAERTQFSRARPNDLENIGQGQRSLHATHPLMLMMICAKYAKNASRIVVFLEFCYKLNTRHTL